MTATLTVPPGETRASDAEPSRPPATPSNPLIGAWDADTWQALGYLMLGLLTGVLGLATFIVVVTIGVTFSALVVGVPVLLGCLAVNRGMAELERRRAGLVLGAPVPAPYPPVTGSYLRRIGRWLVTPATWRDLAHHLFLFPVTLFAAVVSLAFWGAGLGAMSYWAWYWAMPNDTIYIFGDGAGSRFVVDSLSSSMPWIGVGLVLCWVAGWLTKGLARMTAGYTQLLLGPSQTGR
jgi:hypothetical protein